MSLTGKTLFITGASRGIGLAIGLRAARDGANVVIAAKTDAPHPKLPGTIHSAAREIEAAGGKALPLLMDVRSEDQVDAAVARAVATFGGIDILVNNATALYRDGTMNTPMKRFDLLFNVNVRGTYLVTQKCVPHLRAAQNPHVLTIAPAPYAGQPCKVCRGTGLHTLQVLNEPDDQGIRRGVSPGWDSVQRALAAAVDMDRRQPDSAWRGKSAARP
jgi:NAD(P)-dependent dehydrogenase (short-subunit alcohol dehydrogenase family)